MEEKLYNEYIAKAHQGRPVKKWWFVRRGKQILDELEPDHNFLFSYRWFERFQNRYNKIIEEKNSLFSKTTHSIRTSDREISFFFVAIEKFW